MSNPVAGPYIGNALWLGASLASLLRAAGIRAGADQLLCTSVDGFTSGTPMQTVMDGRDALLAVAMNGTPLPVAHGFPVRMVVPGLYGYVSACKWVTDIKVTTFADDRPTGRSAAGRSRRRSRPSPGSTCRAALPPCGPAAPRWPAWPGPSTRASTRSRCGWTAAPGSRPGWPRCRASTPGGSGCGSGMPPRGTHVIEARATDETGYTQTAAQAPPPAERGHRVPGHHRLGLVTVPTSAISTPAPPALAAPAIPHRHNSWSRIWPDR